MWLAETQNFILPTKPPKPEKKVSQVQLSDTCVDGGAAQDGILTNRSIRHQIP